MRVPDVKSMPKFSPLPPIESAPISRITPDIEKNHFDAPMKSKRQRLPARCAPTRRRAREEAAAAERREYRLRRHHGREERDERADAEHEGEALHAGGREHEEDERRHHRHDVRVDDRRQALSVAGGDRRRHGLAGAQLLLDALEDDDVRVRRDADREDHAGDARQRQRDAEQLDQRVEVDAVDQQRAGRDHAEHAVEGDQEQRDDEQADGAGDQALVQRLLAERRGHLRLRDQLQADRQRAELDQVREVLRALDREAALDHRAVLAVDAVGQLLRVDRGDRDQSAVERDGEVLEHRAAGRRPAAAARCRAGRSCA